MSQRYGSWDFFDLLLKEGNVVGTPGAGFGKNGEGFFRLTAFNDLENTRKAVERIKKLCPAFKLYKNRQRHSEIFQRPCLCTRPEARAEKQPALPAEAAPQKRIASAAEGSGLPMAGG